MSAIPRRCLLVFNEQAGAGRARELARETQRRLSGRGVAVSTSGTRGAGHAREIAASDGGAHDLIVSLGGDGTLREVVAGVIEGGRDTPVGLVPVGNANVVARELGIPRELDSAVAVLATGRPRSVDVGLAGGEIFLCMAGVGFDARVIERVEAARRRAAPLYRRAASVLYLLAGSAGLLDLRRPECTLETGDAAHHGLVDVVVSNTAGYAFGWSFAPGADMADGRLDYHGRRSRAPWVVLGAHVAAVFRRGFPVRSSVTGTAPWIVIRSPRGFRYHIDGEFRGSRRELRIDLAERRARILAPADRAESRPKPD